MSKPKVVDKEGVIYLGNEVDRDVTCCEWSRRYIHGLEKKAAAVEAVIQQFKTAPAGVYMIVGSGATFELNHCPMCGTKYDRGVQHENSSNNHSSGR